MQNTVGQYANEEVIRAYVKNQGTEKEYKNIYKNPLCILNNADFNIVNLSIEDKFVNILYSSQCSYLRYYSGFKSFKSLSVVASYHKLVT